MLLKNPLALATGSFIQSLISFYLFRVNCENEKKCVCRVSKICLRFSRKSNIVVSYSEFEFEFFFSEKFKHFLNVKAAPKHQKQILRKKNIYFLRSN